MSADACRHARDGALARPKPACRIEPFHRRPRANRETGLGLSAKLLCGSFRSHWLAPGLSGRRRDVCRNLVTGGHAARPAKTDVHSEYDMAFMKLPVVVVWFLLDVHDDVGCGAEFFFVRPQGIHGISFDSDGLHALLRGLPTTTGWWR